MKLLLPLCALFSLSTVTAQGPVTVTLTSDRDNTLYESATGGLSNGAGSRCFVGLTAQGPESDARRALVRFDLAAQIPPCSTITAVTLTD